MTKFSHDSGELHELIPQPGLQFIFFSTLAVFVVQLVFNYWFPNEYGGTVESWFGFRAESPERFWTFLSAAWVHDTQSLGHFGWNMAYLGIFAMVVEERLEARGFIVFYCYAAVCGTFCNWFAASYINPSGEAHRLAFGASGAVTGCVALAAISWPRDRVNLMGIIEFRPWWLAALWFAKDIFGFITGESLGRGSVGHSAHLGGFLGAVIYSRLWISGAVPRLLFGLGRGIFAPFRFMKRLRPHFWGPWPGASERIRRLYVLCAGDRKRMERLIQAQLKLGAKGRVDAILRAIAELERSGARRER